MLLSCSIFVMDFICATYYGNLHKLTASNKRKIKQKQDKLCLLMVKWGFIANISYSAFYNLWQLSFPQNRTSVIQIPAEMAVLVQGSMRGKDLSVHVGKVSREKTAKVTYVTGDLLIRKWMIPCTLAVFIFVNLTLLPFPPYSMSFCFFIVQ